MIFTDAGTENAEAVGTFLEKASLGIPCQLRTVQDHGESTPMVIDVICENDGFLWRMRSGGTEVAERRLSYIVTDGTDLYLSDGADWDAGERYGDQRVFLVPPLQGTEWVPNVEAMTGGPPGVERHPLQAPVRRRGLVRRPVGGATTFSVSWQKPARAPAAVPTTLRTGWPGDCHHRPRLAGGRQADFEMRDRRRRHPARLTFDPETETLT